MFKLTKFASKGLSDARQFLELYRWLWRFGISGNKGGVWQIAFMEVIGAVSLIGALLFLLAGLNLVDESGSLGEYSSLLRFEISGVQRHYIMFSLLAGSIPLYYLSAFLSLRAALKARAIARDAHTRLTRQLLTDFAAADGGRLTLERRDRMMLSSSFTFGPQICGVALETMLRAFRPLSQLLLIGLALMAVQIAVVLLLILLGLILTPLIYSQQRRTINSSEKVYGEERKQAHRAVITLVDSLSKHLGTFRIDENLLEEKYIGNPVVKNALDEYDKWKMAVDRGQFMMDIGRVIVLYILLVIAYVLTEIGLVSWPILIGFMLAGMKIQNAMSGLMIRVVALVRFIPVLRRVRRIDSAFRRADLSCTAIRSTNASESIAVAYTAHIKCEAKMMRKEMIGELVKDAYQRLNRLPLKTEELTILQLEISASEDAFTPAHGKESMQLDSIIKQVSHALLGGNVVALFAHESAALREIESSILSECFKGTGALLVFSSHAIRCETCWSESIHLTADKANNAIEDVELM